MKRLLLLPCLTVMAFMAWAQGPNNSAQYYKNANGKKGAALKSELCEIIFNRTERQYDDLWGDFKKTDKRIDENGNTLYNDAGKSLVWDMYSNISEFVFDDNKDVGTSGPEGKYYNREHSFPRSWFGGAVGPMNTDLHHLYPTDKVVNGRRSNWPFGETNGGIYKSANNFSKLGACTYSGYTGTVFEPNDMYKGDFARTYFYMVTCYEKKLSDWYTENGVNVSDPNNETKIAVMATLDGSKYPAFTTWQLNMLLTWAKNDRVSYKETYRNNAVAEIQNNRNPFIDYPGLEQYIWGSMKEEEFSYDNYQVPENYSLYIPGDDPGPDDPPIIIPSDGEYVYQRVTSTTDLEEGAGYIIVCEGKNDAMAEHSNTSRNTASVTISSEAITTKVNDSGKPYEFTLGVPSAGKYTFYDATDKVYLAHTSSSNGINTASSATATGAQWTITFSGSNAVITNTNTSYYIQRNSSSAIYRCYNKNQTAIQLYKRQPVSTSVTTAAAFPIDKAKPNTIIYDLQGRKVGTTVNGMPRLKKGIYIMGGRKVIAK